MARWITVKKPFDYRWPGVNAITAFTDAALGEHFVKDEVADYAVENGYAAEGKADASARSRKDTGARRTARRRGTRTAKAADHRPDDAVGDPDLAVPDRPADRQSLDRNAE